MKNENAEETVAILVRFMSELPKSRGLSRRNIIKDSGSDPVRNWKRHSSPLVLSLISYCEWLGLNPCFFLTIAILVQKGKITETQGLDFLKEFNVVQHAFEVGQDFILKEILNEIQKAATRSGVSAAGTDPNG
jgi:hypothetical protein